jgi:hypothetical protein
MERTHVTVDNRANNLGAPQTSWTRRDTLKISWALQCVAVIHDNIRYLHNIPEMHECYTFFFDLSYSS